MSSSPLLGAGYWVVDHPRGAPWSLEPRAFQRVDFGIDLLFDDRVVGIGWHQTPSGYALDVREGSLGTRLPSAARVDASSTDPWRSAIGAPLQDLAPLLRDTNGEVLVLEARFGRLSITIASATYLPDEKLIVPGVDEILVFNVGFDPLELMGSARS